MLQKFTILCDSNIGWETAWYSKHHLMLELAKRNEVLFVEPPREWRYILKQYGPVGFLSSRARQRQGPQPNLKIYRPVSMPLRSRLNAASTFDTRLFVKGIRRLLRNTDQNRLVLFLGNAWNTCLLDAFPDAACTVYHCSDNFSAHFSGEFRDKFGRREQEMIRRVDLAVSVSEQTQEYCISFNPESHMINHGVDPSRLNTSAAQPEDIAHIPHPRIGFVGRIDRVKDFALLKSVVSQRPDYSFVMVGPVDDDVVSEVRVLEESENCFILGRREWADVPAYLNAMDICIMPYAGNDWTKAISCPLKLVEYLAAGKPVVAQGIRLDARLAEGVAVTDTPADFCKELDTALERMTKSDTGEKIRSLVAGWTWEARADELGHLISAVVARKAAVFSGSTVAARRTI